MQVVQQPKNPTLAAILSFLIPGLGQIYNGQIGKGIVLIIAQLVNAVLMTVIIGFFTGLAVLIWAIYDAYKTAESINQQFAAQYSVQYGAVGGAMPTAAYPQLGETTQAAPYPQTGPIAMPAGVPVGMKKCPRCAEVVQGEAQICRYCGHEFTPSAVPQA